MKIQKYGNLIQITFMPWIFPVNCYVFEEEDSLSLIDAGLPYSVKGIAKIVGQLGKPLERIILTHGHSDHVGAVEALQKLYPDASVYISERDFSILKGDRTMRKGERAAEIRGGWPNITIQSPELLYGGERLGSLEVIPTPGHTPGHVALWEPKSGILLAGDTMQTRGGMAVSGVRKLLFPFPAMATWDISAAFHSVEKLIDLQPAYLAPGHGSVLLNPVKPMKQALLDCMNVMERGLKDA